MCGHLQKKRGGPDHGEQNATPQKQWRANPFQEKKAEGRHFHQHERGRHKARAVAMLALDSGEIPSGKAVHHGVMNDLHKPNEAGHAERGGQMGRACDSVRHGRLFSDKNGHRPFACCIAFLDGQDFFLADFADVIGLRQACIREAMPLHGFGKHG